jgi:predicted RND superfamily exporter protein
VFPYNGTSSSIVVLRRRDRGEVHTGAALQKLEAAWNASLALKVTLSSGKSFTLADICDGGPFRGCDRTLPTDCLPSVPLTSGVLPPIPLVSQENQVCLRVADGSPVFAPLSYGTEAVVSAITSQDGLGWAPWAGAKLTGSNVIAIVIRYKASSLASSVDATTSELDVALAFEKAWVERMAQVQEALEDSEWEVSFASDSSAELALDESANGDILLVVVAIVLLVVFAIASGFSPDVVQSRATVAVGGVACIALAIPATFGIMALAGVPYVATVGTTPFLVLSVGIDSVFVVVAAFNRRPTTEHTQARIGHALHEAGPAILLTTTTDLLAFIIGGATSPFLAVGYFCTYTGVSLLVAFLFTLTGFVPLLILDGHREAANRSSLTCCVVSRKSGPHTTEASDTLDSLASKSAMDDPPSKSVNSALSGGDAVVPHPSVAPLNEHEIGEYQGRFVDSFFARYFGPFITSKPVSAIVVVIWMGLLGFSIYEFTLIKEGLALSELAVDGHHLVRYDEWNTQYYSLGFPFNVFTDRHEPLDLRYADVRTALATLGDAMNAKATTIDASTASLFQVLNTQLGPNATATLSAAAFDPVLRQVLMDPAVLARFDDTVRWRAVTPGGQARDLPLGGGMVEAAEALGNGERVFVKHALLTVRTKSLPSSLERAEAMVEARKALAEAVKEVQPASTKFDATVQFEAFIFFEADVILAPTTYTSLAMGAAAIVAVTILLLPHLGIVLAVFLSVVSIDVMLLGSLPLFGTKLNTISGINLLLSIGLAVDAVAHVSHAFLHARAPLRTARALSDPEFWNSGISERRRRAIASLASMARPVLQGTASTMLGLLTLTFSRSNIFRIFFKVLFSTIVLSLVHALVFLPVLLRLCGPVVEDTDEDVDAPPKSAASSGALHKEDTASSAAPREDCAPEPASTPVVDP